MSCISFFSRPFNFSLRVSGLVARGKGGGTCICLIEVIPWVHFLFFSP